MVINQFRGISFNKTGNHSGLLYKSTSYYTKLLKMLKRILYLILFLSQSRLLFASEQKIASPSLNSAKSIHTTERNRKNIPPSADDTISIDFNTNYCLVRTLNEKPETNWQLNIYTYQFLKENALSEVFVQKTLNFFKSRSIHLLNCIWLI